MTSQPSIEWDRNCLGDKLDCAWVDVPYDHGDPELGTFPLYLGRARHWGGGDAEGVVLFNPGGPGAPGVPFTGFLQAVLADLNERWDIVTYDPRGSGESEPLACVDDGEALDAAFDLFDGRPESLEALAAAQAEVVADCLDSNPGISAHQTWTHWADDLEVIRQGLGVETFSWLGVSGGTALGLQYGERYPGHVGRFVLDSSLSPYGGWGSLQPRQVAGVTDLVSLWAESCAADPACPVAADPEGAMAEVLAQAQTAPLDVDGRALTWGRAAYGVILHLYAESSWTSLSDALAAALEGDGSALMASADAYWSRSGQGYSSWGVVQFQLLCGESAWHPSGAEIAATVEEDVATYGAGGGLTALLAMEGTWCAAIDRHEDAVATEPTAAGAPPYLMIQGTHDPATPLDGAEAVQAGLTNGTAMLVVESHGHVQSFSSQCARDAAVAFLADGTLPEDGTRCD